jgi:DNA-binding HxlR family transcriptional regulator
MSPGMVKVTNASAASKVTVDCYAACAIRDVLDLIGDKWSLLILFNLHDQNMRFNELKKTIGEISQRVLTQRLRSLEREGYISRTVYPVSPPKVEYALTKMGKSMFKPIAALEKWARDHHDQVIENRQVYDQLIE